MQEDKRAWFYATCIMLVISILVFILRLGSTILFTLEFEVAIIYLPTIVLVAVSTYLMRVG